MKTEHELYAQWFAERAGTTSNDPRLEAWLGRAALDKTGATKTWHDCLAISELPAVDEALRAFAEEHSEDSAVHLVQAILETVGFKTPAGQVAA